MLSLGFLLCFLCYRTKISSGGWCAWRARVCMITLNIYAISEKFSLLFAWSVYRCLMSVFGVYKRASQRENELCMLHNYALLFFLLLLLFLSLICVCGMVLLEIFRVLHVARNSCTHKQKIDKQINGKHMNVIYLVYLHLAKVLPFCMLVSTSAPCSSPYRSRTLCKRFEIACIPLKWKFNSPFAT